MTKFHHQAAKDTKLILNWVWNIGIPFYSQYLNISKYFCFYENIIGSKLDFYLGIKQGSGTQGNLEVLKYTLMYQVFVKLQEEYIWSVYKKNICEALQKKLKYAAVAEF